MTYSEFKESFYNPIHLQTTKIDYNFAYSNLLNSFKEKFDLFKNDGYSSVWFEKLVKQFKNIVQSENIDTTQKLNSVIDLMIILEIKSKEVEIDVNKVYVAGSFGNYGILY